MISVQFSGNGVGSLPTTVPVADFASGFGHQSRTATLVSATICLRYVYVGTSRASRYGHAALPLIAATACVGTCSQFNCRKTCSGIHHVFASFTVSGLTSMNTHCGTGPVASN